MHHKLFTFLLFILWICAFSNTTEQGAIEVTKPQSSHTLKISIKGLGSPMSENGYIDGSLNLKSVIKGKLTWSNGIYGGLEFIADEGYEQKVGGNSNLALFFGGESKERFTAFLNVAAFRDTKKGIDNQEELTLGGGLALIGKSYEKYILKYSVGAGGKTYEKRDPLAISLDRINSPIVDNRLKLKLSFLKKSAKHDSKLVYKSMARHVHALNDTEDYQIYLHNDLIFKFARDYGFTLSYVAEYSNSSPKDKWSDKISLGFNAKLALGTK